MSASIEKEIEEAEHYFRTLSSNGQNLLGVLDRMINRWHEVFFSSLETAETLVPVTFVEQTAILSAQLIKEKYEKECALLPALAPFKGTAFVALRGNVLLFIYRAAKAIESRLLPHLFVEKKLSELLQEIHTNVNEWHEHHCQGRASHKKHHHGKAVQPHKSISSDSTAKLAELLIKNVLLPCGNDSLYLPLPSIAMMFVGSYITDFINTYAQACVERGLEYLLSRSSRVNVLDHLASLDLPSCITSISSLARGSAISSIQESASHLSDLEIDDAVDHIKAIAAFFLPQEWNRYFKHFPLHEHIKTLSALLYQAANSQKTRSDMTRNALAILVESISDKKAVGSEEKVHEDQVILRFERFFKNPLVIDTCIKEYMTPKETVDLSSDGSDTNGLDPNTAFQAKQMGSFIATGIKSTIMRKAASGIKAVIDWESNAPLVARKSAYYFLSDSFKSLLI